MEEKKLAINITPDVATGQYANMAVISHNQSEFVFDFVSYLPNMPQAQVVARILHTPENAKKLLFALQDNVAKYEKQFGTIDLVGNPIPGSTLPLSFGGGEA